MKEAVEDIQDKLFNGFVNGSTEENENWNMKNLIMCLTFQKF